jgi:serine/threonine protein kinase
MHLSCLLHCPIRFNWVYKVVYSPNCFNQSAAEYGEGLEVSTHGDVYSLGIVLIEMFTGRRPTDDMFRDGSNLHYFAEAALPAKVMEIADSRIRLYGEAENSNATRDISRTKECLAAIIQLGVLCSKQSPKDRPSTSDAAVEMRNIRDTYMRMKSC